MIRDEAEQLDASDLLAHYRQEFSLAANIIYLCGHSLGAMPKYISPQVINIITEWSQKGVCAWEDSDWINMPQRVGGKLAKILGANPDEVIVADSTSINLFKLLLCGLQLRPGRNIILTNEENFPADIYIAQAVKDLCPTIQVIKCRRDEVIERLNQQVAVLMLTHADYRTSELYDIEKVTQHAHAKGVITLFDLSHSTGIVPLALNKHQVDMAVGCSYKYLNAGPGAPAYMFVAKRHHEKIISPLPGWMSHAHPFNFSSDYLPAEGIKRLLCGTPAILSMSALEKNIDFLSEISIDKLRNKTQCLGNYFINLLVEECPDIKIESPINSRKRGGHVAFSHADAYAIKQALYEHGIVCDYREPNLLRFGLSPLYIRYVDIYDTVAVLKKILQEKKYSIRNLNPTALTGKGAV